LLSINFSYAFKGAFTDTSFDRLEDGTVVEHIENLMQEGEMLKFLSSNPHYFSLDVKLYEGVKLIHSFKPVLVPISKDSFRLSKRIAQSIELAGTKFVDKIKLMKLIVSPTRMKLEINTKMEPGYVFQNFENPYLKDTLGNIYKAQGLVIYTRSSGYPGFFFVPSLYFDKLPDKLYFCYDGLRIYSESGRKFQLSLEEKLPKKLVFMGQTIKIIEAVWCKDIGLTIKYSIPDQAVLKIQNLAVEDFGKLTGQSQENFTDEKNNIQTTIFSKIEKRNVYELEFESPGYLIKQKSEVELKLK
jgi:hypothetical protein